MTRPKLVCAQIRESEPYAAPKRQMPGDAGYDLSASRYVQVYPDQIVQIPTNIAVEIPEGWVGIILPRGSAAGKGLYVQPGVVDSGYRGEVMVVVRNMTTRVVPVSPGERVAQLLVVQYADSGWTVTVPGTLPVGARGDAAFGSTGD